MEKRDYRDTPIVELGHVSIHTQGGNVVGLLEVQQPDTRYLNVGMRPAD